jgi:DNA repair protein RecO (recombination protein O)
MEPRLSQALILRLRGLGESDLLLDMFARDLGRVTALVKGGKRSQKRFFGLLLTGHLLEVHLAPNKKGSDLWRLEAASLLAAHLGLRLDFRRLIAASPVWELLLRVTAPQDPHPPALDLALATLSRLERAQEPAEMAAGLIVYLARLLKELGYGLSLDTCLICGRPHNGAQAAYLSLAGGMVCGSCPQESAHHGGAAAWQVPAGLLKGLAAAQDLDMGALSRLSFPAAVLKPGLAFLSEFWRRVAGRDLASLEVAQRFFLKNL